MRMNHVVMGGAILSVGIVATLIVSTGLRLGGKTASGKAADRTDVGDATVAPPILSGPQTLAENAKAVANLPATQPVPPAPVARLEGLNGVTPELRSWCTDFEAAANDSAARDKLLSNLPSILDNTTLGVLDLCKLGRSVAYWHTHTKRPHITCGKIALARARDELDALQGDKRRQDMIIRALWDAEGPIWASADSETIYALFDLLRSYPAPDKYLATRTKLGWAGALYATRQFDEALKETERLGAERGRWTDPTHGAELDWIRAVTLVELKRNAEAVPLLKSAAEVKQFNHAKDADRLLIITLLSDDQIAPAERQLAEYIQSWSPDRQDQNYLSTLVASQKLSLAN